MGFINAECVLSLTVFFLWIRKLSILKVHRRPDGAVALTAEEEAAAAAMRALGGHFQGQLVYDPAVAQTSEWADYTVEGNIARLNEMGITDIDKVYEAEELASGENVVFAGSGITDGLLFHGVKFEKDCTRTSSLIISTLDNTARFTNTVHIKDGAKSIALR